MNIVSIFRNDAAAPTLPMHRDLPEYHYTVKLDDGLISNIKSRLLPGDFVYFDNGKCIVSAKVVAKGEIFNEKLELWTRGFIEYEEFCPNSIFVKYTTLSSWNEKRKDCVDFAYQYDKVTLSIWGKDAMDFKLSESKFTHFNH